MVGAALRAVAVEKQQFELTPKLPTLLASRTLTGSAHPISANDAVDLLLS